MKRHQQRCKMRAIHHPLAYYPVFIRSVSIYKLAQRPVADLLGRGEAMESLLKITSGLNSFLIKINRRRILHRFKLRQNAPLDNLFIFLSSSNFQNIVSNSVSMHQLGSLFSKVSPQTQLPKHRFK